MDLYAERESLSASRQSHECDGDLMQNMERTNPSCVAQRHADRYMITHRSRHVSRTTDMVDVTYSGDVHQGSGRTLRPTGRQGIAGSAYIIIGLEEVATTDVANIRNLGLSFYPNKVKLSLPAGLQCLAVDLQCNHGASMGDTTPAHARLDGPYWLDDRRIGEARKPGPAGDIDDPNATADTDEIDCDGIGGNHGPLATRSGARRNRQ